MKTNTMKAFLGLQSVKDTYLARVREHRAADQLVKGLYWRDGKGCAVGCTIHSDKHSDYERLLGIPEALAMLEDSIFEGLPNELAMTWPDRFLDSIQVGADLTLVASRFLHWLLVDPVDGVVKYADVKTKPAIVAVGNLYARRLGGDEPTTGEWLAAYAHASAYAAKAAHAAYYAAYTHASAAANAARAAANIASDHGVTAYADVKAKEKAARVRQSEKLLELLKAA